MQITYTLTPAQLAALREDLRVTGADPREDGVESHALAHVSSAFDALRDRYRTDAIRSPAFIRRFPPAAYAAILAASEQVPELAAYLARLDDADWVWLGSPETQGGIAELVAGGLLTQGEADAILDYPMPELPAAP